MAEPEIVRKSPFVLTLESGACWWRQCGQFDTQAFCDGSHKDGEFGPVKREAVEPTKVAPCGCKKTSNKTYCDGTHSERN